MRFSDVEDTFWAYQYISYLYCRGIIGGYDDGTFRPANPLTRGQFSKMVVIGHSWNLYNPYFPSFSDVPTTDTFYQYIETAHLRDVVGGYPDGAFRPGNSVTRAQATKMLVVAHGWALLNPATPSFPDVPRSHWSYQYVETAYSRGIVGPRYDGLFGPDEVIVRAELCKMLALTMQQGLRPGDPGQPAYRVKYGAMKRLPSRSVAARRIYKPTILQSVARRISCVMSGRARHRIAGLPASPRLTYMSVPSRL